MSDGNLTIKHFVQDFDSALTAEKIQELQMKLRRFFRVRASFIDEYFLDDLVQETMFRTIQKISQGASIRDIDRYVFTVAKYIVLEAFRDKQKESVSLEGIDITDPREARKIEIEDEEGKYKCIEECLHKLDIEDRNLLVEYYLDGNFFGGEKRLELAHNNNITINALRVKIHRLQESIQKCVKSCLREK